MSRTDGPLSVVPSQIAFPESSHARPRQTPPAAGVPVLRRITFFVLTAGVLATIFYYRYELDNYAANVSRHISLKLSHLGTAAPIHQATVNYEREVDEIAQPAASSK